MTVLVDLDDVLEDLLPAWVNWLNTKYQLEVNPEDVTDYFVPKFFPSLKLTEVYQPLELPAFWDEVKPKEGAVEGAKTLIDNYDTYIVTTSSFYTMLAKERMLKNYFPFINMGDIIVTRNKSIIQGDVVIDDCPPNLRGDRKLRLLMDAPHNRHFNPMSAKMDNVKRVRNWDEILNAIKELE